jgi:YVTN family beta-propeller protein
LSFTNTLQPGDKLTFDFGSSVGAVTSVVTPPFVNSSTLVAGDFSVVSSASQVVISYNGAAKAFTYGDSICVSVSFTASSQVGSADITFNSRFISAVNGMLPYTTVAIVNFGIGAAGPQGPRGPQGPSGPQGPPGPSKRAALDQFWTTTPRYPGSTGGLGTTTVGHQPLLLKSDGADLWVPNSESDTVSRVRASDGKLLDTWTGATFPVGVLVAMGRVFVTGQTLFENGNLFIIDPTQAGGQVTEVTGSGLGVNPQGIAFDGSRIWTANPGGSVSIVTPAMTPPWAVTTVKTGFSHPQGMLFDGSNIWVTDGAANTLLKLDQTAAIIQTVMVGSEPRLPAFDGTNIWVPNSSANSVSVVRAATGAVIATLTGNGLNAPEQAAFDGQRILVTNPFADSVSLWNAVDFTPIGTFSTGSLTGPFGACSDGVNFWITLARSNQLARF